MSLMTDHPDGGWIYLLTNEALPGLVKVGKTDRTPEERAAELSKPTGVPGKYRVTAKWQVVNSSKAEKLVHRALAQHRVKGGEFFKISAVEAIAEIDRVVGQNRPSQTSFSKPINYSRKYSCWIYLRTSKREPGLVKVATSVRIPEELAAELSENMGIPGNFRIAKKWNVANGVKAEERARSALSEYRTADSQFFQVSVDKAVEVMELKLQGTGAAQTTEYNAAAKPNIGGKYPDLFFWYLFAIVAVLILILFR